VTLPKVTENEPVSSKRGNCAEKMSNKTYEEHLREYPYCNCFLTDNVRFRLRWDDERVNFVPGNARPYRMALSKVLIA
jgi:hypothetical protein